MPSESSAFLAAALATSSCESCAAAPKAAVSSAAASAVARSWWCVLIGKSPRLIWIAEHEKSGVRKPHSDIRTSARGKADPLLERMTTGVRLVCVNVLDVLAVAAGEDLLAEAGGTL